MLFRNKLFENQLNIGSLDSLKLEYLSDYKERECSIKLNSVNKIIMSLQIGTVFHAKVVRTDNTRQILVLLALCVSNGYI